VWHYSSGRHAPSADKSNGTKSKFCAKLELPFHQFPNYNTNISIEDFSTKVGKEYIFKPTTGNESLRKSANGVIVVHSDFQKHSILAQQN
jgi:superfamily I DNA and/or RNA helicase